MIYLTEKAAKKIKEISDEEGIGYNIIRVKILAGGCSGFTNDMFFDDLIKDTDEVFELDGVKIICDEMSFQYMDGMTLDFLDGEFESGFKFLNPNISGSCGCGSSISF